MWTRLPALASSRPAAFRGRCPAHGARSEFAAGRQFPVGHQFVAVQLDPRLHETKLLARQVVVLVVQQVQPDDDAVERPG